jgi:ATP/maltotriose-dependent transcriptional regulator MalT
MHAADRRHVNAESTQESHVRSRFRLGQFHAITMDFDPLPQEFLFTHPVTGIHVVTALVYEKQFDTAHRLLQQWLRYLRHHPVSRDAHGQWLAGQFASIYVLLQAFSGELSMISADKFLHLRQRLDAPGIHQPVIRIMYAYLLYMNGKHERAMATIKSTLMLALEAQDYFVHSIGILLQCLCARSMGDSAQAERIATAFLEEYRHLEGTPVWAMVALVRAKLDFEQDNVIRAHHLLTKCLPMLSFSAVCDFRAHALLALSRVNARLGDLAEARLALERLADLIQTSNDRRWSDYVRHERLRLAVLEGQSCADDYEAFNGVYLVDDREDAQRCRYCPAIGVVPLRSWLMLALHQGALDVAEKALGLLGNVCLLQSDSSLQLIVLASRASLEFRRERIELAMMYLNQTLRLSQQSGLYRVMFEEVFDFAAVFRAAVSLEAIDDDIETRLVERLCRQDFPAVVSQAKPRAVRRKELVSPMEVLTDTEVKVLELLAEGLSNRDISLRSGMALTTAKWHLKNIFGKLDAANRTDAVLKAQTLNLIN